MESPFLTEFDLHLLGEGAHYRSYEKLGAHLAEFKGQPGVRFAVWAPNAREVFVIGDFNGWNRTTHKMTGCGDSGIWEMFIPGIGQGETYKYFIRSNEGGHEAEKADPYGFASEVRPRTASKVYELDGYEWGDQHWMGSRAGKHRREAPISIYEMHLGSWRRAPETNSWLTYADMGPQLAEYCQEMGFTHVELMPPTEHPFDGSWGYQTVGYFCPTSRFGTPHEFMAFIDTLHRAGIGVIIDWVPAHFPNDPHGLAFFDGTHLYEHADPRQGFHPDWGTMIFNYGRREVSNFLIGNALFWLDKYHVDGLRVDAVASMLYLDYGREEGQWIPNQYGGKENVDAIDFLRRFNERVYAEHPDTMTFAEESTSWPMVSAPTYLGGLGFGFKWNMGWMNDILRYFARDPVFRKYHQNDLTFSMVYAFSENFLLPFSHDEVVHGKASLISKMPGDDWQKFANLRALYAYMYGHPGKKLLFMGCEFAQWEEWNHDTSLDWNLLAFEPHRGMQRLVRDLNTLYRAEEALHEQDADWRGFEWIDCNDTQSNVVTFMRKGTSPGDVLLFACNFSPTPRHGYRLGCPIGGKWQEVFNSDASIYGGTDCGNLGGVQAHDYATHGRTHTLEATMPPLGVVVFKPGE
ncbi:MAG: 1,4-alpha-glucan branching protein GlgB [Acidobacteria bacterium]|nr:1,4-alpha-glucan branching protein GlgB [Acidobacteriota bacterium]MDA1234512.1 1,4-alpha-glucan branching protein GlgB [Acidobacteriota bacterium]